ncbi:hypothetical protein SVAN01_01469 [Stagonosporopsis vannaccii]|nr:hypothetical protein SVAN01_01469 [Stagonosporopsis vannaccii]
MAPTSLLYYAALATAASAVCPMLGPVFPVPTELPSAVAFQNSLKTLQANIDEAFTTGNTSYGPINPTDTYSIQIFSTRSEELLLDYHHHGSNVLGNRTVDGDSIYRIASTSKVITVYLLLLEAGDAVFAEKVTKYLPELAGVQNWDDITVGALAGYLGDIVSELFDTTALPGGDLSAGLPGVLPPLAANETSECRYGSSGGCNREVFLRNLIARRPAYLPNTTPSYSNAGFATLGLVLEAISNSTFDEVLHKHLVAPLHLTGTSTSQPSNLSRAVIPGSAAASGWDINLSEGPGAAMGGLFSTPNDLTAIGRSILASTLLPGATTRDWLKPVSHTSSLIGAVGRGWEIYRAVTNAKHNRVIDLYTKGGNLPGYGANLILAPDFDVGISIIMAGQRGTIGSVIASVIIDTLLPALDEAARVQADDVFAGTYTAPDGLNSSLALSTSPGLPGLTIETWVSNGTDMVSLFIPPSIFPGEKFQMFPTNIVSDDGKEISWRSTSLILPDTGSPFDTCASWGVLDRPIYGVYGLDEFVFHLGADGKAYGVEPKAFKIVLEKA